MNDFFSEQGTERIYWLAFSGGLDSSVLLALCHRYQQQHPLRFGVIHVNHQVNPLASSWTLHCRRVCLQYNLQLIEKNIEIDVNSKHGFEEEARIKRYAALAEEMAPGDMLLTAHHQNDQAETVLLQLLRGAGTKGLASMPKVKSFGLGFHGRPLLATTRAELEAYAKKEQLSWVEDTSNQEQHYARNYIRQSVMPILEARYPAAVKTLARSAEHIAESQVLLEEYAETLLIQSKGQATDSLSVSRLSLLSPAKQRLVVRTWLQQQGRPALSASQLATLCHDFITAKGDRQPSLLYGVDHLIRRFRDDLTVTSKTDFVAPEEMLHWQSALGMGLATSFQPFSISFRRGGEKVRVPGGKHRTLKNLFQEWGVPVWQRSRIPLLFVGDTLVCVVGYFMDERFQAKVDEMGIVPHLNLS